MKKSFFVLWVLLFLAWNCIHAQNAPVTSAGTIVTMDSTTTIPITAKNFNDITSCALTLVYDPEIIFATAVTTGALLGGNLNANLSIPGKIILGWYDWPGISLPDSTPIFNIGFSKVAAGTSAITWTDDGYSCYYANGSYGTLNDQPTSSYYFNGSVTFQSKAPLTLAPVVKANPGAAVGVPVKVCAFSNIGRLILTMHYDTSALTFQSWTNTSGFPGMTVDATTPGTILAQGMVSSGGSGITLTDSSVLYTLHFINFSGVSTGLTWYMDGGSCEYAGSPPHYPTLIDIPKNSYYLNGAVNSTMGVDEKATGTFRLVSCPNPFTDHTRLTWFSPSKGSVSLKIFNMLGETIEIMDANIEQEGKQSLDLSSNRLCPGIYIAILMVKSDHALMIGEVKLICNP